MSEDPFKPPYPDPIVPKWSGWRLGLVFVGALLIVAGAYTGVVSLIAMAL